jgi:hypothetical protein
VNDLGIRFDPLGAEIGDEIILAGTARLLTQFDFEYFGTSGGLDTPGSFAGAVTARVRFYLNNGPLASGVPSPGSVFYDSGTFAVPGRTSRSTFVFTQPEFITGSGPGFIPLLIPLPDHFTWSVQFTTVNPADHVGVDLYSPPVVGQNFPDYWLNTAGTWSLQQGPGGQPPYNFAARFQAADVPETTGIGICVMSFLALLAYGRWTRRVA